MQNVERTSNFMEDMLETYQKNYLNKSVYRERDDPDNIYNSQ